MRRVSIYGAGQLGAGVADILRRNPRYDVAGPYGRSDRDAALASGADLVIVATTTRLRDVIDDVRTAVEHGSNVLVSAEEAAYPFVVDDAAAREVDRIAKEKGVSVAGAGVNPGFMFDSLVLTLLGTQPRDCTIQVRRHVEIGGFGSTVLRRIGVGWTADEFRDRVERGEILGHAGFPQSMEIVAAAIGVTIDRIDRVLRPVIATEPIEVPGRFTIEPGQSAGVDQTYTAIAGGAAWFLAYFYGHVSLARVRKEPADDIDLIRGRTTVRTLKLRPGIKSQSGSQNMVANSVERVIAARPGWVTVAEMAPAYPAPMGGDVA